MNTNYIIDPSVFYWINIFSIIQTVCAVIGAIVLIGAVVLIICYLYDRYQLPKKPKDPGPECTKYEAERYKERLEEYNEYCRQLKILKKWVFITLFIGAVFVLASIFIPSKQTSVEMLIARTATFENVEWSVQQVKEIVDYIVYALQGVM